MSLPVATLLDIWEKVRRAVQASDSKLLQLLQVLKTLGCLLQLHLSYFGSLPNADLASSTPFPVPAETLKPGPSEMSPVTTVAAAVTEGVCSLGGPVAALVSPVPWLPWGTWLHAWDVGL